MSKVSVQELLEAGVHFGHQTKKWNPKMKKYIFGERKKDYIINLHQTSEYLDKAYDFVKGMVAEGRNILFVGTKKQAQDAIKDAAEKTGMFYIAVKRTKYKHKTCEHQNHTCYNHMCLIFDDKSFTLSRKNPVFSLLSLKNCRSL